MNSTIKKETKRRGRPPVKSSKDVKEVGHEWMKSQKQGEMDACDCLIANCPGCWYPCGICGSNKCSTFCRTARGDEKIEWKKSE